MRRIGALILALQAAASGCGCNDTPPIDTGGWVFTTRLSVHDMAPCPDWDLVESPVARALPADSTPRQLWTWFAYDDPVYQATGLTNQAITPMALSPDGTLWVGGPEEGRMMRIGADGRLIWITEQLANVTFPPAIAPDGSAFVLRQADGAVIRYAASGDVASALDLGITHELDVAALYRYPIALGPEGRVYIGVADRVFATCRGERRTWTMKLVLPGDEDAHIYGILVEQDGSLWINALGAEGRGDRAIRVSPAGSLVESYPAAPDSPRGVALIESAGGGMRLFQRSSRDGEGDAMSGVDVVATDGQIFDFPLSSQEVYYDLDPTGAVWATPRGESLIQRYVRGELQWEVSDTHDYYARAFGADGTLLETFRLGATAEVRRRNTDGAVAWSVPARGREEGERVGLPGQPWDFLLSPDGVVYAASGNGFNNYILAFQTDVIPPPPAACVEIYCNARRNRWAGSP